MQAFLNKPEVKEKYVSRVHAHKDADEIIKGVYWEHGKGCAVGCTIEGNEHVRYETELGIPEQIAHLEDALFEQLPNGKAKEFPLRFLESIKVGADLSLVCAKLVVWQFEDEKYGIKHLEPIKTDAELLKVCEDVVSAYKSVIAGDKVTDKMWEELYQRADKIYDARAGARAWARARAWAGARAGAGAGAGAWAWAWAWARAWAGAGAWAGAWAWAWAGARAGAGAWAGARARAGAWAWAWAGARADYDRLYVEAIVATSEKFLELLKEAV